MPAEILRWKKPMKRFSIEEMAALDPREVPMYWLSDVAVFTGVPESTLKRWTGQITGARTLIRPPAAELQQRIFNGNDGQWFARENKIEPLCSHMFVESKPAQTLFARVTRGNFERHMRLNVVATLIELRAWIDHYRSAAVGGVEDIKVSIRIRFKQDAHEVAFVKFMIRIHANRQTIRVAHEESKPYTKALGRRRLL